MTADVSYAVRTGTATVEIPVSGPDEVDAALAGAAAAAPMIAATPPAERASWLGAIAGALDENSDRLIEIADRETGLGVDRLRMEVGRTSAQLRYYAEVAGEGSYLDATIDTEGTGLARVRVPLGPVAVFGASNFPFAFSVLGTDTASALAAGCPVVVKGHPAHPELSQELARLTQDALAGTSAPAGLFALVTGFAAGERLVRAEHTAAVAFTGSQQAGLALWRIANEREVVIPVFAEMGTVNPVVVTPSGATRIDEIAEGFVDSFSRGAGQYCTKPGLLFVPAGADATTRIAEALRRLAPSAWMLTRPIATAAATGVAELLAAGAVAIAEVPGPSDGWSVDTTLLRVPIDKLRPGSRLLAECFGPVAIVVEYREPAELDRALASLQGTLAAAVQTGGVDDPEVPRLVAMLGGLAGRVAVDEWPTGVAVSWAQQHGGPWPATTAPATTSVGAGALARFTRPVAYQHVPDAALPPALRAGNPWRLPRRVDGVLVNPG
ncbi:NADP-dependent aldehyde dehydrogenase [Tamaricihabitans halophyticus]|uniref:NADP-dependent aldehyde dehydrogenase n=1 Tax=Tamaricihabitans halophyticus TaxID=1262583 RepID=A0A4R2QKI2_9PSEU|nr:aldehyde dehydrogenase family protein [Tamaricihabitans halophyticus]TCP49943.1 NADP-dependent aldehyde dehydrogenase [Tamaricihabitans halophyticus]